jgi:K+-transporting ATPase KdpF subunit
MRILIIILSEPVAFVSKGSYLIGGILAILIFGYLVYTLIKPEKF